MPLSPLCSSILSGSYDNTTRLWSTKGEALMTIPGHSAPVKCVGWIKHGKYALLPLAPCCQMEHQHLKNQRLLTVIFMIYPPAYTYGFVVLHVGGWGWGSCLLRSFGRQKYFLGNSSWHILYLMTGFCDVFR